MDNLFAVSREGQWCGARCIWFILRASGRDIPFERIQKAVDPDNSSEGVLNVHKLEQALLAFDVPAISVECTADWLYTKLPAIVLLKGNSDAQVGHFVVAVRKHDDILEIADPVLGDRILHKSSSGFEQHWTGVAVFVGRHAVDANRVNLVFKSSWSSLIVTSLIFALLWLRNRSHSVKYRG